MFDPRINQNHYNSVSIEAKSEEIRFEHLVNAALTGSLKDIPEEKLSLELLLQTNSEGNSILHIAAISKNLHQVPKKFINSTSVLLENANGEHLIHLAAENGGLESIPTELINQKAVDNITLDGQSIIHYAAYGGCLNKIPQYLLTKEAFSLQDDKKETPLHKAAKSGNIKNVPREFLTADLLAIRNYLNETVIHFVALGDKLENLPPKILTKEFLRSRDKNAGTPFQNAARAGNIKFLLDKLEHTDFLYEDKDGQNLFHLTAKGNCLHHLPKEMLTKDNLFKPNAQGETPLNIISIREKMFKSETLKHLLPILNQDILNEWNKITEDPKIKNSITTEIAKRKICKSIKGTEISIDI